MGIIWKLKDIHPIRGNTNNLKGLQWKSSSQTQICSNSSESLEKKVEENSYWKVKIKSMYKAIVLV